ncbi:polysaccharide deacetylase family protein [Hydrogenivirga sp.]
MTLLTSGELFAGHATILLYHRFGDDRYPTTSVSMEDFVAQMRYLKEKGYRVIPMSELVKMLKEGRDIPDRTVVIAIDDGYRSTMKAYRVLKEFNYPFIVFLYMEAVGRYPDFLTLEQIREMESSGLVEFENHSYSHKPFGLMRDVNEFVRDLDKSERRFEKLFRRKPRLYALPFGYYNRKVLEVLREKGYEAVFTQDPGNVGKDVDLMRIPRQAIVGSWSSLKNFKKKLVREPLPLSGLVPDWGVLKNNPPPRIGAYLKNPGNYVSCRIYVTELGWRLAKRKGSLVFRDGVPKLKRRWNRVGVKCRNRSTGVWAETFWMVIR